jgi:osmotically-inducible protein OsmY
MGPRSRATLLGLGVLAVTLSGCSRQDTERLARIGRKLVDRAQLAAEEIGGKLDLGWKESKSELSLEERLGQRLRWDKALADTSIEVKAKEGAVELRGSVKTAAQRQKALELAEATLGVDKVTDSLQVSEP